MGHLFREKHLSQVSNLLEKPTSGSVFIDGVDITSKDCDIDSVRANMGMVFQNFNLFPHRRVLDNIILAPMKVKKLQRDEAEEIAINLLAKVGLKDKAKSYPDELSGGQKQRSQLLGHWQCSQVMLFDDLPRLWTRDDRRGSKVMKPWPLMA